MSLDIAAYFGCDASDVFERKEQAEGYLAGTSLATRLQDEIIRDFGDRSRAYREGILAALREQL